jgi:hypothetical protein
MVHYSRLYQLVNYTSHHLMPTTFTQEGDKKLVVNSRRIHYHIDFLNEFFK